MIAVIFILAIVGLALHLLLTYVPMAAPIKTVIMVVVVLCVCLWLLQVFGVADIPVPRVR